MKRTRWILLPALLIAGAGLFHEDEPQRGTVRDAAGRPVPGAFVTAHRPETGMEVSVLTDAEGRYVFPASVDTGYALSAHRTGFERARGGADFVLRASAAPAAPSAAYLALLPDGEEKRRFILDCTGCHQFDRALVTTNGRLKSESEWKARTEQMLSFAGASTGFPVMSPSRDAAATAAWLTAHLGDEDDPVPSPPPPPPATAAAGAVFTEYAVPVATDLPHDIELDAEGRVVVTGMMTHKMYRLDPATGTFESVPIPVQYANPRALTFDAEGRWWVLLGYPKKAARYDPATGDWAAFDLGHYPHSIALDAAGDLWFNGHFTKNPEQIGRLDVETGAVTTFDVPTPPMPDGGSTIPYGLRRAPDGVLWGTQLVGNRLVRFDPATERFDLYELPTPYSGPRRPDVAPDGTVWVPAYAAGTLVRFDPAEEAFTEYTLPVPDALPYIVRFDARRGAVWVATAAADAVFRFDLATEAFTTYPLPTPRSLVRHMTLDAKTGDVWVAYGNSPAVSPKIARLSVE